MTKKNRKKDRMINQTIVGDSRNWSMLSSPGWRLSKYYFKRGYSLDEF